MGNWILERWTQVLKAQAWSSDCGSSLFPTLGCATLLLASLPLWPWPEEAFKRDQTTRNPSSCVLICWEHTNLGGKNHFRNTSLVLLGHEMLGSVKTRESTGNKDQQKKKRVWNQRDYSNLWADKDWRYKSVRRSLWKSQMWKLIIVLTNLFEWLNLSVRDH